ncbi:unnamed protein product [Mytilus edulis]|uniref:HMG box domain-containing protein n=1 Tax=Mytilus edulis TaxID=6550 RepID=A0A8S3Q0P1_MYTED|nr:unnamed protein product [Mytilus edulis]
MTSKSHDTLISPKTRRFGIRKSPRLSEFENVRGNSENPKNDEKVSSYNTSSNGVNNSFVHDNSSDNNTYATEEIIDKCLANVNHDNKIHRHVKAEKTPSPRQTVRRKISFDGSENLETVRDDELISDEVKEAEIPRRKKLRSEMTDDELWEGFPQNIRFKRLTPQKFALGKITAEQNGNATTNNEFDCINKSGTLDEIGIKSSLETSTPVKPRAIINIFADFPKVVHENNTSSLMNLDLNSSPKRHVPLTTPTKRSARLQERRESPSLKNDKDLYTGNNQTKQKNQIYPKKEVQEAHKGYVILTPDTQSTNDNEAMKILYRDVISKEHQENNCKTATMKNKVVESETESISLPELLQKSKEYWNTEKENFGNNLDSSVSSNDSIEELNNEIYTGTETGFSFSNDNNKNTNTKADHDMNSFINPQSDIIASSHNLQEKHPDRKEKPQISVQSSCESLRTDNPKTSNERAALKLRIRKLNDGAEVVYSGNKDDHAYVLSTTRSNKGRHTSHKNEARSKRKRFLYSDTGESSVKRRSHRVANASTVGKGPGMAEMETPEELERIKTEQCSPLTKPETTKKKNVPEDEQLLKNNRVGKYACILWSSEHRRHFQQLHTGSSTEDVDNLMRKAWEDLEDRDKLRYFKRAKNAMKDENKHSNQFATDIGEEDRLPCPAMVRFLSLSSLEQDDELKRWLKFFYEVSPNEYAKLKTLEKPKQRKEELKSNQNKDPLQYYRRILYQSILDSKDKIKEIYERKRQRQQEILKESFGAIVKRLITGNSADDMKFSRDVVSKKLAEVLFDLQYLEKERRVGVSGAPVQSESFENLVNNLKADDRTDNSSICEPAMDAEKGYENEKCDVTNLDEVNDNENDFSQELLDKIADKDLPLLEVDSLQDVLEPSPTEPDDEEMFSDEIFEQLSTIFEQHARKELIINDEKTEIRNPASVLNNWVLADQFRSLARGSNYNSMYSLIDRKQLLPFLHARERAKCYMGINKPQSISPNSSKPKAERERYQAKIDRLNFQKQTVIHTRPTGQAIQMVGTPRYRLQVPQVRPAIQMASPHSLIRRATLPQTFVKYTSQPLGRYRVFSVRQTN